uniref:Uncharacterized protein n=1 Tax=Arundo donax TaxID=35708 RepID=A0A0A9F4Y3_ARUDO
MQHLKQLYFPIPVWGLSVSQCNDHTWNPCRTSMMFATGLKFLV